MNELQKRLARISQDFYQSSLSTPTASLALRPSGVVPFGSLSSQRKLSHSVK